MIFYYPNRPMLIPPDSKNPTRPKPDYINSLEQSGLYLAEQKWNGDNVMINTSTLEFWNRQGQLHRYKPSDQVKKELNKWPKNCMINAELVHYKTKTVKDFVLVHCIMIWKRKTLNGRTWGDSRLILEDMPSGEQVKVSPVWKKGFWKLFQEADGEIIEGIVLKNPNGKIVFSATPLKDVSWMKKIRKPSKKYSF